MSIQFFFPEDLASYDVQSCDPRAMYLHPSVLVSFIALLILMLSNLCPFFLQPSHSSSSDSSPVKKEAVVATGDAANSAGGDDDDDEPVVRSEIFLVFDDFVCVCF